MNSQEESPVRNACKESRRFTISRTGEGWPRADVPYLRMRGRWLERAGFAIGRNVRVEVSEGRLIIEPDD
jgi:hypothetical protein